MGEALGNVYTTVQDLKDKPWRNEESKSLEEGMPRILEEELENAAKSYKAKTGVVFDGFHPKVPSGGILGQACTTMLDFVWRWKDSITMQEKDIKERWNWFTIWRRLFQRVSLPAVRAWGDAFQFSQ